jgi:D-tyrosyl-tRNA(Tyr) deacylase
MRIVLQRVSQAEVRVEGEIVGRIGRGLLALVGAEKGDDGSVAEEAARKVAALRIFEDEAGKMNRSVSEVGGSALVVSQFTLVADLSRGRRPGFERAMPPAEARPVCDQFARALEILGIPVATGRFGAMMDVSLVNSGPATFVLDVPNREAGGGRR